MTHSRPWFHKQLWYLHPLPYRQLQRQRQCHPVVEDDATFISDKSIIISEKLRCQPSFAKPKLLSLPPTRASASTSAGLSQEQRTRQGRGRSVHCLR
ncbi:hypothetical protein BT96DRAFT_437703 [Gymnopus androsaceus JB14]|uniref:Uncharacterized protein n=1 Tax=Gymnopus androsaceus JB14 TaxID=1447944 RepID=A0A6A4GSF0_9AGAR|nr:hypothetical protein BT96DRAFT_437703 [Gymnopus androsaceus JB14]